VVSTHQPVFISYSRRDYYFAESLAVHLLHRDVPAWMDVKDLKPGYDWERGLHEALEAAACVVVIASPNSTKSQHVRAEWTKALELGKRVFIAQFLGADLPPELRAADRVDFRGPFRPALEQLVARVTAGNDEVEVPAGSLRISSVPCVPAWVAAMAFVLAVPLVSFCAFSLLKGDAFPDQPTASDVILSLLVILVMIPSFIWFFCVAFLRRRMGMTRLALTLLTLVVVYALPLLKLFEDGQAGLATYSPGLRQWIIQYWRIDAALCAVPIVGLVILLFLRPLALLHWSPTGKAWNWYREHHVEKTGVKLIDVTSRLTEIERFYLVSDPADSPAADRLRDELTKAGAKETPPELPSIGSASETPPTAVLLLTNRTRTFWLTEEASRAKGSVFTVVACAIGLPESVSWLWKREWIDFRHWDVQRSGRTRRLPRLPEAVTTVRLPRPILLELNLLCAFGTLIYAACGAPISNQPSTELTPFSSFLAFGAAAGWAFIWPAHAMVKRAMSAPRFSLCVKLGSVVGVLLGSIGLYALVKTRPDFWLRAVPAAVFLLAAPVFLWRLVPQIAFWFPHPDVAKGHRDDCLAPGRSWLALLLFLLYMLVWICLLMDLSK